MKKRILSLLIALSSITSMCAMAPVASAAEPVRFYVATDGDDTEDGSEQFPLRTFQAARQAVINYKQENGMPEGGIEVIFREGTYSLGTGGYEIPVAAGGEDGKFVTYKAYDGEDVILDGAWEIEHDYFELVTDQAINDRLPENSRGKVYSLDLADIGVDPAGNKVVPWYEGGLSWTPSVLFSYNGKAMEAARWPNEGKEMYGIVLNEPTIVGVDDYVDAYVAGQGGCVFQFDNDRIENWANAGKFYAAGDWGMGWFQHSILIDSVNVEDRSLSTESHFQYFIKDMHKAYYYNLLEELDRVGEFYVDETNGIMYILTDGSLDGVEIKVNTLEKPAIHCNESNYVRIQGFTIQNSLAHGINAGYADPHTNVIRGIEVIDCKIRNMGNAGIYIVSGRDCLVSDCTIYDVGGRGIHFDRGNDKYVQDYDTLKSSGNVIQNNEIFSFSQFGFNYLGAIEAYTNKTVITHNVIHDTPHTAIILGAQGAEISYNEFYNCVTDSDDAGVIYGGRTYLMEAKINNNYIHKNLDVGVNNFSGIYLDDALAGITMTNNILENLHLGVTCSGINWFENNLILGRGSNNGSPIDVDWRMQWENAREAIQSRIDEDAEYINNENWRAERPWLFQILDENLQLKDYYPHVSVKNNLMMRTNAPKIAQEAFTHGEIINNYETNTRLAFKDYENGDLTLTEEAVAEFSGFKPIDFYSIGIQPSEYNPQTLIERRLEDCVVLDIDNSNALVDNEKKKIDAEDEKVVPVIKEGRTLVPLRFIAEGFGADVAWDDATRTVSITQGEKVITMPIDSTTYKVGEREFSLDVPAQIMNGRTMVPVRVVSETLGKQVFWDDKGLIIIGEKTDRWNSVDDKYRIWQIFESLK